MMDDHQIGRPPWWRRVFICGFSIGFGAAIGISLIVGSILWSQSRLKPWNSANIVASFDYVEAEVGMDQTIITPCFHYTLENKTEADYLLDVVAAGPLVAKLRTGDSLCLHGCRSTGSAYPLKIDLPIFIPAKHKLSVKLRFGYQFKEIDIFEAVAVEKDPKALRSQLAGLVGKEFPNLDGFFLVDKQHRFEIDFPKGW